jgi:hypothetical protein
VEISRNGKGIGIILSKHLILPVVCHAALSIITTISQVKLAQMPMLLLLSLVVGLALLEVLRGYGAIGLELKWPNDIYYRLFASDTHLCSW